MRASRRIHYATWLAAAACVLTSCGTSDHVKVPAPTTPPPSSIPSSIPPEELPSASPELTASSPTASPTPAPAPAPSDPDEETGLRAGVYSEHAKTRSAHSLGALSTNSCLADFARSHARSLATTDNGLRHQDLNPILSRCAMDRVGENVASGQTSAAQAQTAWMNSSGHRANILNGEFNRIGASVHRSADDRLYWVVVFGRAR